MRWLFGILINAIIFVALAGYFKDSFYIESFGAALAASFTLAILNIIVKPILILLTLPITVFTLGLFLFVVNGLTLLLVDEIMGSSFEISGFWMAVFISMIMSLINVVIQQVMFDRQK